MNTTRAGRHVMMLAGLLVLGSVPALPAQDSAAPSLALDEYIVRLDRIAQAIAEPDDGSSTQLSTGLPESWRVRTAEQTFDIPTADLARQIRTWLKTRDPALHARLIGAVRTMRSEADRFNQPARDSAGERGLLSDILARPEFRDLHGPTWKERLQQRALMMMNDLFLRLFPSSISAVGRVAVYALIVAALIAAILALARRFTHDAVRRPAAVESSPVPALKAWPAWLEQAQDAAAKGCWRDAVHASYWCAVLFLETKGVWRCDRSRTPREYLRLLPPASDHRAAFASLTERFELIWYGRDAADAGVFADAMTRLHTLGCPPA